MTAPCWGRIVVELIDKERPGCERLLPPAEVSKIPLPQLARYPPLSAVREFVRQVVAINNRDF